MNKEKTYLGKGYLFNEDFSNTIIKWYFPFCKEVSGLFVCNLWAPKILTSVRKCNLSGSTPAGNVPWRCATLLPRLLSSLSITPTEIEKLPSLSQSKGNLFFLNMTHKCSEGRKPLIIDIDDLCSDGHR